MTINAHRAAMGLPPWPPGTFAPMGTEPLRFGGWECPRCHACYSPSVTQCPHCGPKHAVPAEDFTGGPEHDLCAPPSEGGLCDHDDEPAQCTGGRHCSCLPPKTPPVPSPPSWALPPVPSQTLR